MQAKYHYNLYHPDGHIVGVDVTRSEIAKIIGCPEETVNQKLRHMARGQKTKLHQYNIECVLDRTDPPENHAAKNLLMLEWDKTVAPFRKLAERRRTCTIDSENLTPGKN